MPKAHSAHPLSLFALQSVEQKARLLTTAQADKATISPNFRAGNGGGEKSIENFLENTPKLI